MWSFTTQDNQVTYTEHKEPELCTVLDQVSVAQLVKHGSSIQW